MNKELMAGVFFVAGIIIFVLLLFFVGMKEGIIESKYPVEVIFKNIGGLTTGAPVRLLGVNVGSVSHIDFLKEPLGDNKVRVVLSIYEKYKNQVQKCSDYSIKTAGILGDKLIEISSDNNGKTSKVQGSIVGKEPLDIQNWAENLQQTSDSFRKLSDEISTITEQMRYVSYTFKRLLDRIEDKLIKGQLLKIF